MPNRPVHFEINVADPDAAAAFYKAAFGWNIQKWEGPVAYWLVTTGEDGEPGINGGLAKSEDGQSSTVNTLGVDSIDDAIERITTAGGSIVVAKHAVPGIGWQAYFTDPQGTLGGIHQQDPSAA